MLQDYPKLHEALKKFAIKYCDNHFKYLYEADVQVLLSRHLESAFHEPHEINREQTHYPSLKPIQSMDIGKVHREYPTGILYDNVVLGKPLQLKKDDKNTPNNFYENGYRQPVRYAIELKLVPLYLLPRTKGADDSMDDYKRFVGYVKPDNKKKSKLDLLKKYQTTSLEYGLQLTLFQSLEDQEIFLKNHNPDHRNPKYKSWFARFRELIRKHDNVGYYYVDLASKSVKPVYPQ